MPETHNELNVTLTAMQQTLAALARRVAALEAALGAGDAGSPAGARDPAPTEPEQAPEFAATDRVTSEAPTGGPDAAGHPHRRADDEIPAEILLAISAAVAAYLGERAHVRQIRLISSQVWSQQGRVNVQASHALHR